MTEALVKSPTDVRWHRAQEVFAEMIAETGDADMEDSPGAKRQELLSDACSYDEDLESMVRRLLAADEACGDFIEKTVTEASELLGDAIDPVDPLLRNGKLGKYEILEAVGFGGFGRVYRGRDPDLRRDVAIKTCAADGCAPIGGVLRKRFFREAQIAASLQHPNIVTIYDFGTQDGIPFIVQELLTGEDLSRKIQQRAALPLATRLDYLMQIARGLAHAHEAGILHRDVKPANMRVLESGRLKILDFGIARLLDDQAPEQQVSEQQVSENRRQVNPAGRQESRLTSAGLAIGTVGYLAPEQLDGGMVDGRADIFSFGVLAYELLSYSHPFPGNSCLQISNRLMLEPPKPLSELESRCPPVVEHLVHRCLEKDRENRYSNFQQVIDALGEIIARITSVSSPVGLAQPIGARRRTWGLAAVVLILAATGAWLRDFGVQDREDDAVGFARIAAVPSEQAPVSPPETSVRSSRPAAEEPVEREPVKQEPVEEDPVRKDTATEVEREQPTTLRTDLESTTRDHMPQVRVLASAAEQQNPIGEPAKKSLGPIRLDFSSDPEPSSLAYESPALPSTPRLTSTVMRQVVVEPQLLERPKTRYPARARRRKREAQVLLAVLVDTDGRVATALISKSNDPGLGFDEEARRAAAETRFLPGYRDGVVERMWTRLEIDFRLP